MCSIDVVRLSALCEQSVYILAQRVVCYSLNARINVWAEFLCRNQARNLELVFESVFALSNGEDQVIVIVRLQRREFVVTYAL